MLDCKPASIPMAPGVNLTMCDTRDTSLPFQELIGSLLFLAKTTRPDIAFATSKLSQFMSCWNETHFKAAKDVLRYLQGTQMLGLEYSKAANLILKGFCDSDYAACKTSRKSISGYCFYVNNSLITWGSQKQSVVAVSSTEAEYISLANAAKEAVWLDRKSVV